jgi:hypothetical protein
MTIDMYVTRLLALTLICLATAAQRTGHFPLDRLVTC